MMRTFLILCGAVLLMGACQREPTYVIVFAPQDASVKSPGPAAGPTSQPANPANTQPVVTPNKK